MAVINKYGLDGQDDFIGFTFNGHHSSEYRIIRVSSNNRYEQGLVPSTKDTAVDVAGRNGSILTSTKRTTLKFKINFAFDYITEDIFRGLRNWLGCLTEEPLIFDELPYKSYKSKVVGEPRISYIAFDEPNKEGQIERVYKGEGEVNFICYEGVAVSVAKTLADFDQENKDQWAASSGLKENLNDYNRILPGVLSIKTFNAGDFATPFLMRFQVINKVYEYQEISYEKDNNTLEQMFIDLTLLEIGKVYLVDTKNHLLIDENQDKVLNISPIIAGDYFDISTGEGDITFNPVLETGIELLPFESGEVLLYNYIYN